MGLKAVIEKQVFAGRTGSLGNVNIIVKSTQNAPTAASKVGTFCVYTYGGAKDVYICTVASGTWVKISV